MSHYHDSDDLKMLGDLQTLAPLEFSGFLALDRVEVFDRPLVDGRRCLRASDRELIAHAVACSSQCPSCLEPARRTPGLASE